MTFLRKISLLRWIKGFIFKHMHHMISCKEFEVFILDYLDDELPPTQKKIFELHMRLCRECRDYLAAYKRSMELGHAIFKEPTEPVPDNVPEDLIKAILEARRQ